MRLYVFYSVMTPLFGPVVKELQSHYGVAPDCPSVLYGRDDLAPLQALGLSTRNVRVLTDYLDDASRPKAPDLGYLREMEQEYGDPHLQLLISNDRSASTFEHRRALRLLETCFRVVTGLFDELQPEALMSDPVACTLSYVQYLIARRRKVPFLGLTPSRLSNRLAIIGNPVDRQDRVNATFERFRQNGTPAPLAEEARGVVEAFRRTGLRPPRFHEYTRVPGFTLEKFHELVWLARRRRLDPKNFCLPPLHQALMSRVTRVAKARLIEPKYFEQPVAGERFVLFPLHLQPESTTLILAPYCMNQIAVIENVARTLPVDHLLYVKEHGVCRGRRPLGYHRSIKQIPNVRLITPDADTHDLIRRSSATCVINSTVGWEAILYEKPVVTLGDVSYNSFPLVQRVRSYEDLPGALNRAIYHHAPDPEMLVDYIAANIAGTYDADINYNPGFLTNPTAEPKNIRRLADAVASELGLTAPPTEAFASGVQAPVDAV